MNFPKKHTSNDTNIFSVMSGLAVQHNAINLSQGFPDFPLDPQLTAFLQEAAATGFNQYAPMPGLPALREAISNDFKNRYGVTVDMNTEITVTPGATYGIYTAFTSILSPGDEVILFEPAYDSYIPNIEMNGAVPVPIPLALPDFSIDWNVVKDKINPKTRAIIINTPHNPSGAVFTHADWEALAALVRGTNIVILSDEVYEQIIFDGLEHLTILKYPELRSRSFVLYSFGKVFNNTGWKIGYCIAPPEFTDAYRKIHQYLSFTVNTPGQYALAKHLASGNIEPVGPLMERKRNLFLDLLNKTRFTIHKPVSGSYFQLAGYDQISDLPDMEFARWLTIEHGVATIPLSPFYKNKKDDKLIRFCFAKKEETLVGAVERLKGI